MEDSVDRHVARWRGWDETPFDEEVEGVVTRIQLLAKHMRRTSAAAVGGADLDWPEYETLHALMIRATPGRATPTLLATRLRLSPAGITGRLDVMERAGLLRRVRSDSDRRSTHVEVTDQGRSRWRRAMRLRGEAEEELVRVLPVPEQQALNGLLRRLLAPLDVDTETD